MELPQESRSPDESAASPSPLPATDPASPAGSAEPLPDDAVDSLEITLPGEATTPREIGLWAGVLVLLTLAVYWPSTDGVLLWTDLLRTANPGDLQTIWLQRWIDAAHYPLSQYHPVGFTIDWFIYHVFGRDAHGVVLPFGYHVVSLILHCGAAVLLWRVLHRLRLPGAWTAAMLFAVLPINAETVSWISQIPALAAGAGAIGSVYCYLRFRDEPLELRGPGAGWYAGAIGLYGLAVLSKSTAWAIPGITWMLLLWQGRARTRDAVLLLPWLIVGVVLALAATGYERQIFANAGDASGWSVPQHVVVVGRSFWFYLGKTLCPISLSVLYPIHSINPEQPAQWLPLAAMLGVLVVAVVAALRARGPLVALLSYILLLAPASGIVHLVTMRQTLYADHQAYLASAAVIAAVVGVIAAALRHLRPRSSADDSPTAALPAVVLSAAVILLAGATALAHSRVFASPLRLWTDVVSKDGGSAFAHNRLALAEAEAGELAQRDGDSDTSNQMVDAALAEAQTAATLDPASGEAESTWGRILSLRNQDAAALEHLTRAIQLNPKGMDARIELSVVLLRDKQYSASIRALDDALAVQPHFPITHRLLGEAYDALGPAHLQRAIAEEQQAIAIDPNDLKAHEDLANLLGRSGDDKGAIAVLRDYVAQHDTAKDDPVIWNALGQLTARTGDMTTAISFFKAALALDPTMDDAAHNMALAQGALDTQRQTAATRAATQASTQPATKP